MGENIQSDNPFNSCYASFCKDRRRGDLGVTPLPFCHTLSTPERPVKFGVQSSNCFEMIILSG